MEPIASEVWGVSGEAKLPGGVILPLRMTVVRLPDRTLWLHSAVPVDDATAAAIDALGTVRHLVVPSLLHDLHAASCKARWPAARVYGPPGLAARRPDLGVDEVLGDEPPAAWGGALRPFPLRGVPKVQEVVFLHRESRTLLVTDLVFHVVQPATAATRLLMWTVGCSGRMAATRSWRWIFAADREAFAASVGRLLEEDFDRVVPAHGAVGGGTSALRDAVAGRL